MPRASTPLIAIPAPLPGFEIALRVLPGACGGSQVLPVNEESPILRLEPGRELTWPRDWNSSIVNRIEFDNFVVDGPRPHLYDEKKMEMADGSFAGVMLAGNASPFRPANAAVEGESG